MLYVSCSFTLGELTFEGGEGRRGGRWVGQDGNLLAAPVLVRFGARPQPGLLEAGRAGDVSGCKLTSSASSDAARSRSGWRGLTSRALRLRAGTPAGISATISGTTGAPCRTGGTPRLCTVPSGSCGSALPAAKPDTRGLQEAVARVIVEQARVTDVSGQDLHRFVAADLLDLPDVGPAIGGCRHEARPQRMSVIARRIEPGGRGARLHDARDGVVG